MIGVDLVRQRRRRHRLAVGLQDEDRAEPHRHRLAVVVRLADQAGADQGGGQPGDDRQDQHRVHQLVVPGGRHEHRTLGAPPVDQDRRPAERGQPGDRAERDGLDVVGLLAQPDRAGPGLRNHQADDVAEDHHQNAEMKQRAADPQQPAFVELRRSGGPAELVVPVAPPGADHQDRDGHVRHDVPEQCGGAHRADSRVGSPPRGPSSNRNRQRERLQPDLLGGWSLHRQPADLAQVLRGGRRQRSGAPPRSPPHRATRHLRKAWYSMLIGVRCWHSRS